MNSHLLQAFSHMNPEARSVYSYLSERAEIDAKLGMTQQEISRHTRLSVDAVREVLGWLESPLYREGGKKSIGELSPFIKITASGKIHKVHLLEPYSDVKTSISFTFEDKDDQRIKTLEKEVLRLASSTRDNKRLSTFLKGERAAVISEIESDLGRNLSSVEAFMLGGVIWQFGPERLKGAWRTKAFRMKNPVQGIAAMFANKAFGKPIERDFVPDVHYPKLTVPKEEA